MDIQSITQLAPVLTGTLICILLGISLFRGSNHAVANAGVFFLAAALCGSAVFSSISWEKDKGEIRTVAGAAAALTEVAQNNSQAIDLLKVAVSKLEERISLALATTVSGSLPSQSDASSQDGVNYIFPTDSLWSTAKDGDFCTTNPVICAGIDIQGDEVLVPKSAYDAVSTTSTGVAADLTRIEGFVRGNEASVLGIQEALKALPQ